MNRQAFSLLEVIIATAVLAASAMVLSSLIGLGSKFGNRAEERTIALSQAESLLDEFLAGLVSGDDQLEEITGELPGPPQRGFRISATPFEIGSTDSVQSGASQGSENTRRVSLLRVTVMLFETSGASASGEAKPLVEISRLIRQPQPATDSISNGMQIGTGRNAGMVADPTMQGGFP